MSTTSYIRGHRIRFDDVSGRWFYKDGIVVEGKDRACTRCGRLPTESGHDACLGKVPGAISACCGHGVRSGYLVYPKLEGQEMAKLNEAPKDARLKMLRSAPQCANEQVILAPGAD